METADPDTVRAVMVALRERHPESLGLVRPDAWRAFTETMLLHYKASLPGECPDDVRDLFTQAVSEWATRL